MKIISHAEHSYLLRFDRGEDFIASIQDFCMRKGIKAGFFSGLGACDEVSLSWYNLETKEYETTVISENLEITSLTGNIGLVDSNIFAHTHGIFGKRDLSTIAGHVNLMRISATCEVKLDVLPGSIERIYDEETGLKLME